MNVTLLPYVEGLREVVSVVTDANAPGVMVCCNTSELLPRLVPKRPCNRFEE